MSGGEEEKDGFFLCDAGEVEEIVVLLEGQGGVGVGGVDVVGLYDGEGTRGEECGEVFPM